MIKRHVERRLCDEIVAFVSNFSNRKLQKFKENVTQWGNEWIDVGQVYLNGANYLESTLDSAAPETFDLLNLFVQNKDQLKWEQSYRKEDGLVGDDMLENYAFAEIIGQNGPFVSKNIRAGMGVWGPNIVYPRHAHQAEEIYIVLGGSAEFKIGNGNKEHCAAGETLFVESGMYHGFRTLEDPLSVFYLWQSGNLREISSFH